MKILDLPPELLQVIVSLLSPKDICHVRETCSAMRDVCDLETVWAKLCFNHHCVLLPVKEQFSHRAFYQKILHKYAPAIGYWQQMDNGHHGGILKVHFTKSNTTIKIVKLESDESDVHNDLIVKEWISITLNDGNVLIERDRENNKLTSYFSCEKLSLPEINLVISLTDRSHIMRKSKIQRVLTPEWIRKYHGQHSSGSSQLNALAPGIFKGEYGGHGVELIHLLDGQGVKVTGDDNVPFNKVTFRVTFGQKIDIPVEMQNNVNRLNEITASNNIENYIVTPGDGEFENDLHYDFLVPHSMYMEGDLPHDKCLGRWLGEAQIAQTNYQNPSFIPAHFILFNEDEFAVMFLGLNCISMYHRVKSI